MVLKFGEEEQEFEFPLSSHIRCTTASHEVFLFCIADTILMSFFHQTLDVQLYIHTFPASGVHVLIKFLFVASVLRRQTSHPSHECREHDVGWDWKDTHGRVFGTPLPQCRTLSSHSHSSKFGPTPSQSHPISKINVYVLYYRDG